VAAKSHKQVAGPNQSQNTYLVGVQSTQCSTLNERHCAAHNHMHFWTFMQECMHAALAADAAAIAGRLSGFKSIQLKHLQRA